ncbi:MAG: hypothetical protein GJ676_19305 [Rhodobacteraceae bacterium]|nr:hypothetical protein [Paracoccaceae bacterium]
MTEGSFVLETRVPATDRLEPLFVYDQDGEWPLHLALHAIPGGGVSLILDQGACPLHQTVSYSDDGRTETLRVTYSWDALRRWGQLAVERPQDGKVITVPVRSPRPMRVIDAKKLLRSGPGRFVSSHIDFMALSAGIEPIGPMPSLVPSTPIATPDGFKRVADLRRGDLVLTPEQEAVPVLHKVIRTVPARGSFQPIRLRAPFFGLWQDIDVSPSQRLLLSGSEVEYLFGQQAVLLSTRHLTGTPRAYFPPTGLLATYVQVILPRHEALNAAGTTTESLFVGRLRRNRDRLERSLLNGIERNLIPEHGRPIHPVLRAFDATILAERRVA